MRDEAYQSVGTVYVVVDDGDCDCDDDDCDGVSYNNLHVHCMPEVHFIITFFYKMLLDYDNGESDLESFLV